MHRNRPLSGLSEGDGVEERFSPQHSFTRSEVEDATHAVAQEARARGLLVRVTTGYRALALRQFVANQLAFVCAVPLIFGTAIWERALAREWVDLWMAIAVLSCNRLFPPSRDAGGL